MSDAQPSTQLDTQLDTQPIVAGEIFVVDDACLLVPFDLKLSDFDVDADDTGAVRCTCTLRIDALMLCEDSTA